VGDHRLVVITHTVGSELVQPVRPSSEIKPKVRAKPEAWDETTFR